MEFMQLSQRQRLVRGRHGLFIYNMHDMYISKSLELYGEYCEHELMVFAQIIRPGDVVWDIGGNIGAFAVAMARMAGPTGQLVAFEPQLEMFNILAGNLAINDLVNARALLMALGSENGVIGIPNLDYTRTNNFGGVSLLSMPAGHNQVECRRADDMTYLPAPDFVKIDVEGMEPHVLKGAAMTLQRSKPTMYVENNNVETSAALIQQLWDMNYDLYWHLTPLYNENNFAGSTENIFPGLASYNMICVHRQGRGLKVPEDNKIIDKHDHPLKKT